MDYEKLKQRVLAENDLMETVSFFVKDNDRACYADRHAIEYSGHDYDPYALDPATIRLGIALGLDLLRHWSVQRKSVTSLLVSEPFLAIDEEWVRGRVNPAPPSVNICLAKSEDAFLPVIHESVQKKDPDFAQDLDLTGMTVGFIEGYDDPDEDETFGAWVISVAG